MARQRGVRGRRSRPSTKETTPTGVAVAAGSAVVVVAAFVTVAVPPSAGVWRIGVVAVALAVFAALTGNVVAVAAVGVLAFGVFDGFLVNQLGELSWHGADDAWRIATLAAAAVGLLAGSAYRAVRHARLWRRREEWVAAQARDVTGPGDGRPSHPKAFVWNDKEIHRG
ncbi:hypothetical protein HC031_09860 [Planosporangium thailandense]|uniref:DUF4118 domain-containing protein n=1 Tax=Planosporangium thailandense TaxID=765197 RepID=A0ABX0XVU3_9ACTN|nr:hypothetical protein [Planosporangium thailandense]NJC70012.1 hypothetical protein [Planosporangium thailandense]